MNELNLKKIFRLYLPSLIFFAFFSIQAVISNLLLVTIVSGIIALIVIVNVFIQNINISRTLGTIFLLGSLYMMLAMYDDFIDGEATIGYLFGLLAVALSITLSVQLIIGYKKHNKQLISSF